MKLTQQQQALRLAGKFLRIQAMGYDTSRQESKTLSDLCFLALPMKLRLNKAEIEQMEKGVLIGNGGPAQ